MDTANSEQTANDNAEADATENAVEDAVIENFLDDINALANERGRPVLLLNRQMDEFLNETGTFPVPLFGDFKQASVLLNSPGGSATATYKMILALRQYVDDVEVLVVREAKSAATLFCLGADTIYMGREGELGPLDPQIRDRTGSVIWDSSLKVFKGLDILLEHSLESFDAIIDSLLRNALWGNAFLDVPNAFKHAEPLFAAIVSALYRNVNFHELGEAARYLAEIEEYAFRAMRRWGYKDKDELAIRQIARRLVWTYPSHDFMIDLTEAQEIGLNAEPMSPASEEISKRILDTDTEFWFALPTPREATTNNSDCSYRAAGKDGNEDGNNAEE